MKDMSQLTHFDWSVKWKALYIIGKRLLKPRFGLVPLWNMKDMSPPTHLNLSVEWRARYSFGNDFWNPYLDWCPSKTRRIWANRLIWIDLWSEKFDISTGTTFGTHIWTCAPLKHGEYKPTDSSYNDMWSEKLNISSKTTFETHIWTCAPLKHGGYKPTDSSYNDLCSEKLNISSRTTIETHIWTCAPLHEEYEPTDSF